jgi:hypothetical protein
MSTAEYRRRYLAFQAALGQTRIVALGAALALDDFPERLPGNLPKELKAVLVEFGQALLEAAEAAAAGREGVAVNVRLDALSTEHRPLGKNVIQTITTYWLSQTASGLERPPKPDFRSIILAQELTMHLAHLDGFLADSLRAMCVARPELLCRDKKISWEDVVKAGSYDTLLSHLVEDYVYEFGWRSVRNKVSFFQTVHGLIIPTQPETLGALEQAEAVRHLVVHNAGRVSREYLKRSGRRDVQLGEFVSIHADFTESVAVSLEGLAADVFNSVTAKYLAPADARESDT